MGKLSFFICTALGLVLFGSAWGEAQGADVFCRITAPRPARTFYLGEGVALSLQGAGPLRSGQYSVVDYYGQTVDTGTFKVGAETPQRLALGGGWPLGIYYLHLVTSMGERQEDAFCVLPRPDANQGDYALFSFHYTDGRPDVWGALSQIGCRVIRHDMGWPNLEPRPGQLDFSVAQRVSALAQQYGIQLIPILGYTPAWCGQKPLDGTGRVAVATHTWPSDNTTHWQAATRALVQFLQQRQVAWPATATLSPQAAPSQDYHPLVHSWEIWNEVDQGFYYGYWGRYLDLLRIAEQEIKAVDPWATVLYGGSTGHWTQLGMTYTANGQYYFDKLAFHPGGDINRALEVYFTGAPQIGNGYGLYRSATFTESYPRCPPGVTDPQYMLRLYTTLRKWHLDTFCWFGGAPETSGLSDAGPVFRRDGNGDLLPNPKYVALGVARWQLCHAKYVGPLSLREGVEGHLFLRHGWPFLVIWADEATTVTLDVVPGAWVADEMGRRIPLGGSQAGPAQLRLTPVGVAVGGLNVRYIAQALRNQAEVFLTTQQGFVTDKPFGYIGPLERDASAGWSGWATQFRNDLEGAARLMNTDPTAAPSALGQAQAGVNAQVMNMLRLAENQGQVSARCQSVVWRLQAMSEWLGAVLDSYAQRWGNWVVAQASVRPLQNDVEALRVEATSPDRGLARPIALQSLRRAHEQLQREAEGGLGIGAYRAVQGEYEAASFLARIERPVMKSVVITADFRDAKQLTKSLALVPGKEQRVRVFVYNYTARNICAYLNLEVPSSWKVPASNLSLACSVPPGEYSRPLVFKFTIPAPAGSWETRTAQAPGGFPVNLRVPAGLDPWVTLRIRGALGDGRQLLPVSYPVLVGDPIL